MTNLYVPDTSYACYSVIDKDTIRAYQTMPYNDSYVNYIDYYVNSHYMEKTGFQHFSQYTTLPTCLSSSILTDDIYYRNDLDSILIIFLIFCIFAFYLPIKLFARLYFRR